MFSKYFCGNLISEYGRKHGKVDYKTFAESFEGVLNNSIIGIVDDFEMISGFVDNTEEKEEIERQIEEINSNLLDHMEDYGNNPEHERLSAEKEELEDRLQELEDEENEFPEVFQWFIIDDFGAELCKDYNEIVYYSEKLDMYLWGVTHYGTSWDYVLTNIDCEKED